MYRKQTESHKRCLSLLQKRVQNLPGVCLALWVKNLVDEILIYFSRKKETICIKYQRRFSGKNKKKGINL